MEPLQTTHDATTRNPYSYTLSSAARATGKNKSTIHRAIKNGKISVTRDENGVCHIDPVELHRVFPPVASNDCEEVAMPLRATYDETPVLRRELEILQQERERERNQMQAMINDLQQDRDHWRRQVTHLLESRQEKQPEEAKRRTWLGRFFKGKS